MTSGYPLEDLLYQPRTLPVDGKPNSVVAKWGPPSQLRWFRRFWGSPAMRMVTAEDAAKFYCSSLEHLGLCCASCQDDEIEGYFYTEHCCCLAIERADASR